MDKPNNVNGRSGRPAGIPVSRAVQILPGIANDDLREAIAAINRVHGDGMLPTIPLSLRARIVSSDSRLVDGLFTFDLSIEGLPAASSIQILSSAPHRSLVAVHEIGHFIDLHGLPGLGFASADPDVASLDDWSDAIDGSHAVETLREFLASDDSYLRDRATRLLQVDELWARSYAQFVTIHSGHSLMLTGLDALRNRVLGDVYLPRQWDDDDFTEIDAAIATLFRGLGWIE